MAVAAAAVAAEAVVEPPAAFLAAETVIVVASMEAEVWHMTVSAAELQEQVVGIANRNLVYLHSSGDYIRVATVIVAVVGECAVLLRGPQEGDSQWMFAWSEGDNPTKTFGRAQDLRFYQSLLQLPLCLLPVVLEKMIEYVQMVVFAALGMLGLDSSLW